MSELTAYQTALKSREKGRPTALKYIEKLSESFIELHGDRRFGDDSSIVAGLARINDMPVTIVGVEKGTETADKVKRNFGMANPEGYRKAMRLMKQAEKFFRPVLCLVDTAGAFCGIGAEERGQAEAIASSIMGMMGLRTPILSIIIGEGGSGGALGLAASDEVWITETSTYSVISPEGCASILWKDAGKKEEAAACLKLTAVDLKELGAVERIIEEKNFSEEFFDELKNNIAEFFAGQTKKSADVLVEERYERFRKMR